MTYCCIKLYIIYRQRKQEDKPMKAQTVKKCKKLFYQIIKDFDDNLQELSRVAVKMFDTMFEYNFKSTDEKEHSEMSKWIRETLLKYCIAMYDDEKQFYIKDDGTVVI